MNTIEILFRKERKVCGNLLQQENIKKIYEDKKAVWLDAVYKTKALVENLKKANNDQSRWSSREIIIKTTGFLSDMNDEFAEEVDKLSEKTYQTQRIYKNLDELPIDDLRNSSQKALFVLLGYIYEKEAAK